MSKDSMDMKKTKIGMIPLDWEFSIIGNYCDVITGGTPSTKIKEYFNPPEIPWMRSGEIKGHKINSISAFISKKGLENSAARILPKNSVVIALAGQGKTRGTTAPLEVESSCNQSVACMVPNGKLNYIFLHYHLSRLYKYIRNITGDVGREGLNLKLIRKFPLILPPLNEQQKIASVLSNVDDTILQTDKTIENLKIIKKGLMQRLFTEGIGHTEFKETKLGKIPKEWDIVPVSKIGKVVGGGTPDTKTEIYWNGHIPWATPTDITSLNAKYISHTNRNISNEGLRNSSAKILPPFSLLMTSRASIGYCAINTRDICTNQGFQSIIPNKNTDVEFLYYIMQSSKVQNQLVRFAYGSTFLEIPNKDAKKIKIHLPKLAEQQKFVSILSRLDNKIINEYQIVLILKEIKKGLMQELLTGKKRVKIAN